MAFVEQEVIGADRRALDASYAVRRPCFDRGAAERQTLPAFTTNDLVSGLFFRREMRASTPPTRATEQRQQRPRSKSVGRTATPKKDPATTSPAAGGSWVGPPVAASTPKSAKQGQTSSKSPVDYEAVRGERLSNYGQGTLMVGRRAYPPAGPSASSGSRHAVDGCSRLLSGRRSVDSGMSRTVPGKHGDQGSVGELGAHDLGSTYGYASARRRCITPVNEMTTTDTSSLFSGYQLRRPQLPPTPASAVSDSETPSYYASASGRRSLPRTGCIPPHAYPPPPAFYHTDSSRGPPSCPVGGPYWPPCSANSRPQSSATSTISGSADNIRKNMFLIAVSQLS